MEVEYTNTLKLEIERKMGRRILSSADCLQLCEEIFKWTNAKLGFNTVRRFFSLLKADHQPSLYTLNTLSTYCGFSCYDDFVKSRANTQEMVKMEDPALLNYLVLLFKNMEISDVNDATYFNLVQHTICYLEQHTYLIDRFQKEIAQTKNGQLFYFEQFIHIDWLNSYYGEGIQYYLFESKSAAAQVFARSLLCFRSWLTADDPGLQKHYSYMLKYTPDKSLKPSICARYFSSQLFFADKMQADKESIMVRARQFYAGLVPHKEHYASFYCFEIIMSEALILTGQFEEALFYIEELFAKLKRYVPSYIDVILLETICLYKAIVYAHTGRKQKAAEILGDLAPLRFCFLSKQYLTILFLQLKKTLKARDSGREQLDYLIAQTGFERLASLWQTAPQTPVDSKILGSGNVGKVGQINDILSL